MPYHHHRRSSGMTDIDISYVSFTDSPITLCLAASFCDEKHYNQPALCANGDMFAICSGLNPYQLSRSQSHVVLTLTSGLYTQSR